MGKDENIHVIVFSQIKCLNIRNYYFQFSGKLEMTSEQRMVILGKNLE